MPPQLITLTDSNTGSTAKVLAGFGFNCFSFQVPIGGEPVETIWAAPGFESGTLRPTASGTPVLFPFAGRLSGTSFRFGGREYPLELHERLKAAIHGFVHNRPWRVVEQTSSRVTGEFHSAVDEPSLLERWPADFRIRIGYEVRGATLRCEATLDNPDQRPLPCGFGLHGYYRVPLGASGDRDACLITAPVRRYWELENMFPTGRILAATGDMAVAGGLPYGATHFDDVFTDIEFHDHLAICRIDDGANRRRLSVLFDDTFRECVLFNPPHRDAICFEPYSCAPDAFRLAEQGIETGLHVLQPGESFQARMEVRLEAYE